MSIVENTAETDTRHTYVFRFHEGPEVIEQFMDYCEIDWEPLVCFPVGRGMLTYVVLTTSKPITPDIKPVVEFHGRDELRAVELIETDFDINGGF